jgi:RNA ligase
MANPEENLEVYFDTAISDTPRKLVKCTCHPDKSIPLKLYNYTTPQGQKKAASNARLAMARGLILEAGTGAIVGRPMLAFPNYDAKILKKLTDTTFTVMEKVDGSLGIWFCYRGTWMMATRGSFNSEQALEGKKLAVAAGLHKSCDSSKTYCLEIVYPTNRIVIDYGNRKELVLLAVVNTQTGEDTPNKELPTIAENLGVTCAKLYEGTDPEELRARNIDNEEGYVIRFNETGVRAKVKFQNYYDKHSAPKQPATPATDNNDPDSAPSTSKKKRAKKRAVKSKANIENGLQGLKIEGPKNA